MSYKSTPLIDAITATDVERVRTLVHNGADVNKPSVQSYGLMQAMLAGAWKAKRSPLSVAIDQGDPEIVSIILEAGADPNAPSMPRMWLPLCIAAGMREPAANEIVRLLIDAGANVNAVERGGRTALRSAITSGSLENVQTLMQSTDATHDDRLRGWLRWRNDYLRHEVAHMLSDYDRRPLIDGEVNTVWPDGWTALLEASGPWGDTELQQQLLDRGADPNLATAEGWTPLMSAVVSDDIKRVAHLIAAGADVSARELHSATLTVLVAIGEQNPDVVELLLSAGAHLRYDSSTRRRARSWAHRDDWLLQIVNATLERDAPPGDADQLRLVTSESKPPWVQAWRASAWRWRLRPNHSRPPGAETSTDDTRMTGYLSIGGGYLVDLACSLWLVTDNWELRIDSVVVESGRDCRLQFDIPVDLASLDRAKLILRPEPALAVGRLDTWEVWGEPIIVRRGD